MAYKDGEGTLRRLCNINTHSNNILPLSTPSTSTMLTWNPFHVCEIEVSSNGGPRFCCGTTKEATPCKNSIKLGDTAVRNQARVPYDSGIASQPLAINTGQYQTLSGFRRHHASDNTDRSPPRGLRQDPPVLLSASSEPMQTINPFVTTEMLRTNSVPWHVSPARPAILTSVTNIWAGVQDLTLRSLSLSGELENIHCVFCLAEDEEQAHECVILRCDQCRAQAHLSCIEMRLEKRRTGFGTSCCVW